MHFLHPQRGGRDCPSRLLFGEGVYKATEPDMDGNKSHNLFEEPCYNRKYWRDVIIMLNRLLSSSTSLIIRRHAATSTRLSRKSKEC